jgi:hypothetical protein
MVHSVPTAIPLPEEEIAAVCRRHRVVELAVFGSSQRNLLAHEYRDVRHEKIWSVLREHLPRLVAQLEPLLPPPPKDG